jgi:hypothetical protein
MVFYVFGDFFLQLSQFAAGGYTAPNRTPQYLAGIPSENKA